MAIEAKQSNPAVKFAPLRSAGTALKRGPLPLRWAPAHCRRICRSLSRIRSNTRAGCLPRTIPQSRGHRCGLQFLRLRTPGAFSLPLGHHRQTSAIGGRCCRFQSSARTTNTCGLFSPSAFLFLLQFPCCLQSPNRAFKRDAAKRRPLTLCWAIRSN